MTTSTTNLGLTTYNNTTDGSALFATFRADQAGTVSTSNMNKIDVFAGQMSASVVALQANKPIYIVPALYASANYYVANGVSGVTSYFPNMMINLSLDTTSNGAVTLNINSLGTKSLQKFDINGNLVNFDGAELKKNKEYLFKYNGTVFTWMNSSSTDQISATGTSNDLLMISSSGVVVDSGIGTTSGGKISGSFIQSGSTLSIISGSLTLATTGITAGSYTQVQFDAYGRAVSASPTAYANVFLNNLTSASANVDFNPDSNNVRNLGSAIKSWFYGFINKIVMVSGSASTPSASQVVLYNNNGLLESKDSNGNVYFVSQKKKGNFFVSYPNPTLSNGATAATQTELTASNYTDFNNVGFTSTGSPTGTVDFALPWDYDGGSFTANMYFRTSGSVSGSSVSVKLGIAGRAYASGDSLDQSPSSFTYTTTTSSSSANIFFISPTSGSFIVSGSPSPLNLVHYVIQRDNSVTDNLSSEIKLNGVMINYTRSQN